MLDILLKLCQKKSWLRSQVGWIIVQSVEYMKKRSVAERTLSTLVDEGIAKTPEGVGIWIASGTFNTTVQQAAWSRMVQAGAQMMNWFSVA